jgi:hypothetical protein
LSSGGLTPVISMPANDICSRTFNCCGLEHL